VNQLKQIHNSFTYGDLNSYWLTGNPSYFESIFSDDPYLSLAYRDENFSVFRNNYPSGNLFKLPLSNTYALNFGYNQISDRLTPNLIKNPSFEHGLNEWIAINPESVKISEDSEHGESATLIYGQEGWWPNVRQTIPTKGDTVYDIKFYIKGHNITDLHAKVLWFDQTENVGDSSSLAVDFIEINPAGLEEGKWNRVNDIVSSPANSKAAQIVFLGSSLQGRYTNTTTLVDNVTVHEVTPTITGLPREYQIVEDYNAINPSRYSAKLHSDKPFMLAFDQRYDPSWQANIYKNNRNVQSLPPVPLYGLINGFYINQTGAIEVILEHKFQSWFYNTILLYIALYSVCGASLLYFVIARRIFVKNSTSEQQDKRHILLDSSGLEEKNEVIQEPTIESTNLKGHLKNIAIFSLTVRNIISHFSVLGSVLISRFILQDQPLVTFGIPYLVLAAGYIYFKLDGRIPIIYALIVMTLEVIFSLTNNEASQTQLVAYWLTVVGVVSCIADLIRQKYSNFKA
jgi:hypothetical protein